VVSCWGDEEGDFSHIGSDALYSDGRLERR
jgi:hypothetical protein